MTTLIQLFEDNAGGLYLQNTGGGFYYADMEHAPAGHFAADAAALLAGDVTNWTAQRYEGEPPGDSVGRYYSSPAGFVVEATAPRGPAASRYIGTGEPVQLITAPNMDNTLQVNGWLVQRANSIAGDLSICRILRPVPGGYEVTAETQPMSRDDIAGLLVQLSEQPPG